MWTVNTLTLVDFLEPGDIIKDGEGIFCVDTIDYDESLDKWVIQGTDQHWEEQEEILIPDGHMVELMFWYEPE